MTVVLPLVPVMATTLRSVNLHPSSSSEITGALKYRNAIWLGRTPGETTTTPGQSASRTWGISSLRNAPTAERLIANSLRVVFAVLVVVGSSNAVNLTDGLDGLATGSSIFTFGVLGLIAYWQFRHASLYGIKDSLDFAVIAASMTGALTAFLWFNAPPAKIFMGDVGSLGIGAGLGALCVLMNLDFLLLILGGLFVIETMSVILQVFSFRVFHRRIFKMAPIHHHFELLGWPETTVIIRFWILAGIFTALGVGVFYADFVSLGTVVK